MEGSVPQITQKDVKIGAWLEKRQNRNQTNKSHLGDGFQYISFMFISNLGKIFPISRSYFSDGVG